MNSLIILVIFFVLVILITNNQEIKETFTNTLGLQNTYTNIEDAVHGVAISKDHFYAINTNSISKHDLHGKLIKQINLPDHPRIHHLNDAVMVGKNLFVTNLKENKKNTIEVFNDDLVHQYHINVLGDSGVLTWIDYFQKKWFGCFAHTEDLIQYTVIVEFYTSTGIIGNPDSLISRETNKFEKEDKNINKDRNTDLNIQDTINIEWSVRSRWYFPSELYERMKPFSCTGGSFDSKGRLYITTNKDEIIVLNFHPTSILMTLDYIQKTKENVQGVSWNRKNNKLYGVGNKSVIIYNTSGLLSKNQIEYPIIKIIPSKKIPQIPVPKPIDISFYDPINRNKLKNLENLHR